MKLRGMFAAAAVLGSACAVTPSARAADDGYANVFSSLFSAVGVIKPDPAPDIAYRERPPLVLPPQPGLPKPAEAGPKTAAWPNDPDVLRHRKEADEAKAPRRGWDYDRNDQVLSAAELAKGRAQGGDVGSGRQEGCNPDGNNRTCLLLSPDELKAQSDRYASDNPSKPDEVVAGTEPERVYLTQPPKGYMKATKSVKATNDGPVQTLDASNPRAYFAKPPQADE